MVLAPNETKKYLCGALNPCVEVFCVTEGTQVGLVQGYTVILPEVAENLAAKKNTDNTEE
jgi:hypothetical protein